MQCCVHIKIWDYEIPHLLIIKLYKARLHLTDSESGEC